ncbi:MAG: response regulator [Candidatus Micrarchaeia archaeon]
METTDARILVIDDDDEVRQSISLLLRSKGFSRVDGASGAKEGVKMASESRYDLILLDMIMPKVSGWGALEEISRAKITTRVLVVSAVGLPEVVERKLAKDYPSVMFMQKTRMAAGLVEKIEDALEKPAGAI